MDYETPSFEDVHEKFRSRIHHYLAGMVGDAAAEELTQETFLKVSSALSGFRGDSKLSTWIYKIATNLAIDLLRTHAGREAANALQIKEEAMESGVEVADRNVWTGEAPDDMVQGTARKQMNTCLQSVIDELPEQYRTVIVLSDIEGFKDREIAEILGITTGAAKIRLHRARVKLKKALEQTCTFQKDDNNFTCEPKLDDPNRLSRIRPKD